jgi:ribosomal protein L11 methylase PrmA
LRAIREVEVGREALHVVHSQEKNRYPDLMVISEVIDGTDWRTHWKNKLPALR